MSFSGEHLKVEFSFVFRKISEPHLAHCLISLTCHQTQSKKESKQLRRVLVDPRHIIAFPHYFHNVLNHYIKFYDWFRWGLSTCFKVDSSNSANRVADCLDDFGCLLNTRSLLQSTKELRVLNDVSVRKRNANLIKSVYSKLLVQFGVPLERRNYVITPLPRHIPLNNNTASVGGELWHPVFSVEFPKFRIARIYFDGP